MVRRRRLGLGLRTLEVGQARHDLAQRLEAQGPAAQQLAVVAAGEVDDRRRQRLPAHRTAVEVDLDAVAELLDGLVAGEGGGPAGRNGWRC